jgi:hypothetical protein
MPTVDPDQKSRIAIEPDRASRRDESSRTLSFGVQLWPLPDCALSDCSTCGIVDSWWNRSASNRDPPISSKELVRSTGCDSFSWVKIGRFTSHAWRATRTCVVSGLHRSLRPLPSHRTWAPAPRWTASLSRPISSERRKPVWAASGSKVWSQRPSHVVRSGAARIASSVLGNAPAACRAACLVSRGRAE